MEFLFLVTLLQVLWSPMEVDAERRHGSVSIDLVLSCVWLLDGIQGEVHTRLTATVATS